VVAKKKNSWCYGVYIIFVYQIQVNIVFVSMEENKNLESRIPLFWDMATHQWAMESQCFKNTIFP
jgi:hypothetical protein